MSIKKILEREDLYLYLNENSINIFKINCKVKHSNSPLKVTESGLESGEELMVWR